MSFEKTYEITTSKEELAMRKIEQNEITMTNYEGALYGTEMNTYYTSTKEGLMRAYEEGAVIEENVASAGADGSLVFYFNDDCIGYLSADEYEYNASPKYRPKNHAIGHPKCFVIKNVTEYDDGTTEFELSRKDVHKNYFENYLSKLSAGDVVPAKIKQVRTYSVYVDLGFGYTSLIRGEDLFTEKKSHIFESVSYKQNILCMITGFEDKGKVLVSHKELIGTNCMNLDAAGIRQHDIVTAVLTAVIGDNAMIAVVTPGLCIKVRFNDGAELPAPGTFVRVSVTGVDRAKDRVRGRFVSLTERKPDDKRFSYFIPEKALDHEYASEFEAA